MIRALFGAGLLCVSSAVCARPVDVWLMAGQSNMVGGSNYDQLPAELIPPQEDVPYWYWINDGDVTSNGWDRLHPFPEGTGTTYSAELTFGRRLADTFVERDFAIVKVAVNGTTLGYHWLPDSTSIKHLYDHLVEQTTTALNDLRIARPADRVELAGMVWVQGESDSNTIDYADVYGENLATLAGAVRQDFDKPDLPFLLNELNVNTVNDYVAEVRAGQEAFASSNPFARLINGDDLAFRDGMVHYDGIGRLTLGERFADLAISLTPPEGHLLGNPVYVQREMPAVPEPAALVLFGGLGVMLLSQRHKRAATVSRVP